MKWPALLALALVLAACGGSDVRPVEMKMDLSGGNPYSSPTLNSFNDGRFFHNGFPTDLRRSAQTGRIDLSDFPRRLHPFTALYLDAIQNRIRPTGYPMVMPVYLPLTGPVDVAALPGADRDYTLASAPIQVVDVDADSVEFGRRFPLQVSLTTRVDPYRPADLLQILPTLGVTLRPNTTYAAFVTAAAPLRSGYTWQQNRQLEALLSPGLTNTGVPQQARERFAQLRAYLQQQGIAAQQVMAATVWTTGDPTQPLRQGAQYVSTLPAAAPTDLRLLSEYPDYCIIEGSVQIPGFQKGIAPYLLVSGDIEWNASGEPVQQYTRDGSFVVTIPKNQTMPAAGFPMLFYHHGAGGDADQVYTRGKYLGTGVDIIDETLTPSIKEVGNGPSQIAAERGWASAGFGGHLGVDHMGVILGFGTFPYNLYNPVAMLNSYHQMVWERVYFRRVLNQLELPSELCPEAIPNPVVNGFRFDADHYVVMGQSLGNWTASLQMAVDPDPFAGAVLTGVAGTWIRLMSNRDELKLAISTGVINQLPINPIDDTNPFMMLLEWTLAGVDPVVHMDSVLKNPVKPAPHILAVSGINDEGGYEPTQRPLLMALGLDLAGPDLGDDYDSTLFPHMAIAGSRALPYPVRANAAVPGQGNRTAVVVRYENTHRPDGDGHHVAFDLDAPKHQYGCLLQYLAQDLAPWVGEGWQQGGPCL